jgi:hypothetical protein
LTIGDSFIHDPLTVLVNEPGRRPVAQPAARLIRVAARLRMIHEGIVGQGKRPASLARPQAIVILLTVSIPEVLLIEVPDLDSRFAADEQAETVKERHPWV